MTRHDKPKAVAPLLLTVRALIAGTSRPVTGLFIAFKLARPADTDEPDESNDPKGTAAQVARVVESPKDFGKEAKKNKSRYKRILEEYKQQLSETIADPSSTYVLGITDVDGYLEPVYDNTNPWHDRLARREPDSFKFAAGEKYSALFIRHPSPDVARAATRLLNHQSSGRGDVDFSVTAVWGSGGPTLQSFTVEQGSGNEGEQFVIRLPSTPDFYVPLRTDGADKWWLYALMPHGIVESVRTQVKEFVKALGLLKYPASGHAGHPYDLEMDVFHHPLQAATARFQEQLFAGESFEPADWDKAHDYNSWASEIGSLRMDTSVVVPRLEQGGVVGPETARWAEHWGRNHWLKPPEHLVVIKQGGPLMLGRGAFAFNAWSELAKQLGCKYGMESGHSYRQLIADGGGGGIRHSIHKSGLAADMTGGRRRTTLPKWPVRFEAEFRRSKATMKELALALLDRQNKLDTLVTRRNMEGAQAEQELAEAKSAQDALPEDASKRQKRTAEQRVKRAGKKPAAVTKKYKKLIANATKERDEAQKRMEAERLAAQSDRSRMPGRWRMRFRVYGHSTADVFNKNPAVRESEIERLKNAIARWAGVPWLEGLSSAPDTGGLDGEFLAFVKDTYLRGVSSPLVDPWLRKQFEKAYEFAKQLLALDGQTLIDRYFRDEVTQWKVNFYERDGGTDLLDRHTPTEGNADFPARDWAQSWLNLSALGHGCQMHRISPHKWPTRDQTSLYPRNPEKVPPLAYPMTAYLKFEKDSAEQGDIVAAIEDIAASRKQAPELAQREFSIEFRVPRGRRTEVVATALPDEIDALFFKEWRHKIDALSAPAFKPGSKTVYRPGGAQIVIVLNELRAERQAALRAALDLFRSDFSDKQFVLLQSGSLVDDELPTETFFTGSTLATAVDMALARLTAEATAKAIEAEAAAAAQAPPPEESGGRGRRRKRRKDKKKTRKEPKTKLEDWSILVQPVFSKDSESTRDLLFLPNHVVLLPARENAAHLEWWHFQHHSVRLAGTWGALINECGYSTAVLSTPDDGNPSAAGEPVHVGLGYTSGEDGEIESTPWPGEKELKERPSNYDRPTDEAVEEDTADIE